MTSLTDTELDRIASYLRTSEVEVVGTLSATQIAGGRSNLTYRLEDERSRWVLRMPPRAGRTPSAHDVGREYRVIFALGATGVPVAPTVALCEDESVLGAPFAVVRFVDGVGIHTQADLKGLDKPTLVAVTARLVEALASLHRVDAAAVGLERLGRPYGYAERQIKRWSSQWCLVGDYDQTTCDAATELCKRLSSMVPEQQYTGIVHGDFRIDNTLLDLNGAPSVAAIVDWELSTLGDPVADVAMMCAYRNPALDHILGAPSAWTSDRLPQPLAMAADYEAAGGVPLADFDFHLALAYFKIAVIAAGIDHRYRAGAGFGPGFETSGLAVPEFLTAGLEALGAR